MNVIHTINELRPVIAETKHQHRIAFVPTMGNLHQGHIDLVERARELAEKVIVSIFVNPMQFAVGEDLDRYPRTLEADIEKLEMAGVDLLFAPDSAEIYGNDIEQATRVIVPGLSGLWCGASRPGHFDGVTTIVNKLFNLVQPDFAVFGEKDFQQLTIIQKMVADLNMSVEIIAVPTRREADGLAMSSRNGYLDVAQRQLAPRFQQELRQLAEQITNNTDSTKATEQARQNLITVGFKVDYIEVCRQSDLQLAQPDDKQLVILGAVFLGDTRLIDNLTISR